MAILQNNVNTSTSNMVAVVVAAKQRLSLDTGAFTNVYAPGETVSVPSFEVAGLRRDKVIV